MYNKTEPKTGNRPKLSEALPKMQTIHWKMKTCKNLYTIFSYMIVLLTDIFDTQFTSPRSQAICLRRSILVYVV